MAAQSNLDDGIQAIATGQATAGLDDISSALRLNPDIAYDPGLQQATGAAQADQGRQTGLADYAEAVRPVGRDLTLPQKATLFSGAIAGSTRRYPGRRGGPGGPRELSCECHHREQETRTCSNWSRAISDRRSVVHRGPVLTTRRAPIRLPSRASSRPTSETSNSEVRSLALTYIALAWLRLGNEADSARISSQRSATDTLNENVYAREISAGLYVPGTP